MMREVGADDLSMRKDRAGLPEAAAAGCVGLFQVAYFFYSFSASPRLSRAFIKRSSSIVSILIPRLTFSVYFHLSFFSSLPLVCSYVSPSAPVPLFYPSQLFSSVLLPISTFSLTNAAAVASGGVE